jgi:hypothetical protein
MKGNEHSMGVGMGMGVGMDGSRARVASGRGSGGSCQRLNWVGSGGIGSGLSLLPLVSETWLWS